MHILPFTNSSFQAVPPPSAHPTSSSTMAFKCILTLAAAALPLAHAASLATGSAYQSPSTQWSLLGCVQDQYPTNRVMCKLEGRTS